MKRGFFPAVLALAACGEPDPPPAAVQARPAAAARPASLVTAVPPFAGGRVRFQLRAFGGAPLYLENCNGAFSWGLEQRVDGAWRRAWTVTTNACHSAPILIPPAEARVFDEAITLGAGEALGRGTYRVAVHGLYRTHRDDHADSTAVPHGLRVSEPFVLESLRAP